MSQSKIVCPNCNSEIEIASALSGAIRQELEQELKLKEKEIASKAKAEAQAEQSSKVAEVTERLEKLQSKLEESQKFELELRKQKNELEQRHKETELEISRKLDEERQLIKNKAKNEAIEERRLVEAEKDKLIEGMRRQIDDLKLKSEQGSQQLHGEVMELELEAALKGVFPFDVISPVARGVSGADVIQEVRDGIGVVCGKVIWETKRTKTWSDSWLTKLRDDQRSAKADFAVIVSSSLPASVSTFDLVDGIWICSWSCYYGLAVALRKSLIDLSQLKRSQVGLQDKTELLFKYLCSVEFKQKIEGMVEAFSSMKSDLDDERKSMQRIWAKREKQLERASNNTVGLYGDLQGIVGGGVIEIPSLTLKEIAGE